MPATNIEDHSHRLGDNIYIVSVSQDIAKVDTTLKTILVGF